MEQTAAKGMGAEGAESEVKERGEIEVLINELHIVVDSVVSSSEDQFNRISAVLNSNDLEAVEGESRKSTRTQLGSSLLDAICRLRGLNRRIQEVTENVEL